jgi:hypothetical protein
MKFGPILAATLIAGVALPSSAQTTNNHRINGGQALQIDPIPQRSAPATGSVIAPKGDRPLRSQLPQGRLTRPHFNHQAGNDHQYPSARREYA